jgi:SPP1 gp7 family putative phage head morphogenesis protein
MSEFKEFWKKLSSRDIHNVRQQIDVLEDKGKKDSTIIRNLQKRPKLKEEWQAKRAFETESKRLESIKTKDAADYLGMKSYYVVLDKNACPNCRKLTNNGKKVFTHKQIGDGDKILIPHHPHCRCTLSPVW